MHLYKKLLEREVRWACSDAMFSITPEGPAHRPKRVKCEPIVPLGYDAMMAKYGLCTPSECCSDAQRTYVNFSEDLTDHLSPEPNLWCDDNWRATLSDKDRMLISKVMVICADDGCLYCDVCKRDDGQRYLLSPKHLRTKGHLQNWEGFPRLLDVQPMGPAAERSIISTRISEDGNC